MLTEEQLIDACRNIGYDLTCGACAEQFFCGSHMHKHDPGCKTVKPIRSQVAEFHEMMGQPILLAPQVPSPERVKLRARLVTEETIEMLEALYPVTTGSGCYLDEIRKSVSSLIETLDPEPDLPELVDALQDIDYVVEGTRLEFGVTGAPVAAEVHRSNMAKVWPDGTVHQREDGKVLKPDNWTPPNIEGELRRQGWKGHGRSA